jgi:hypothetical protein
LAGGFTYTHLAPVIRSITPNTNTILGGASATLNGANFLNGATVTIGGTVATNVVFKSTTQLTIRIPKGTAGRLYLHPPCPGHQEHHLLMSL